MKAYVNGKIVDLENARISISDRGLLYGDGVFESLRTFGGKPFMLKQHIDRLGSSAKVIGISIKNYKLEIINKVNILIKQNGFGESYVKIIITRGEMSRHGISPGNAKGKPAVVIMVQPLAELPEAIYMKGWRAVISSIVRPDSTISRIKSLNYLQMLLAKMEADRAGVEEAFVCDSKGNILEATTSNVFIVKNGVLITPPLSAPILPGTMRAWVIRQCQMLNPPAGMAGVKCQMRMLNVKTLLSADECFITNSGVGIMPIVTINKKKLSKGKPGPMTQRLLAIFKQSTTC
ncbi:MAG: aminotransferase class IV [Candidatus Margulisiibacteriota bacterium]